MSQFALAAFLVLAIAFLLASVFVIAFVITNVLALLQSRREHVRDHVKGRVYAADIESITIAGHKIVPMKAPKL